MALPRALQVAVTFLSVVVVSGQNCGTGCQSSSPCQPPSTNVSVAGIVSNEFFAGIIAQAGGTCPGKKFYSRAAFINATTSYPQFGTFGYEEDIRREIAAFFAHVARETRNFCYVEEVDGPSKDYCDERNKDYACVAGKSYHGRGPMQLSWNFNYGAAGDSVGFDGLGAPETVSSDPVVSFKTALWFWTNKVQPVLGQGFGATVRAINGALECDGVNPSVIRARVDYYTGFCRQLGVAPGDNLTC